MARVAFIMEQTLGHVTHARNLHAALPAHPNIAPEWLPIQFPVGGLGRLLPLYRGNWSVRASWRARRALDQTLTRGPLDALVFHTQVTSLFSVDRIKRIPTLISLDATPFNFDRVSALGGYTHQGAGDNVIDRQKFLMNRRAFQAAATLVPWSEWTRQSLVDDYGVDPARIQVLAPGAAAPFFDIGRKRLATAPLAAAPQATGPQAPQPVHVSQATPAPVPGESRPVRILFVGGDWARKGGPQLLEALAALPAGSWHLNAVTRDPVPQTPGLTVHHGVGPNSPALLRLFADADLFVLPSLGECLAVVLMEATAAGLPVITTDVGALAEAVRPGHTGMIVPPGDVQALRQALSTMIANPAQRRSMGQSGHALARERFDADANNRALLDIVAGLVRLGSRPGRAA
jgi:glycosyltransferase involved in cell wall biosynthesis